MPSPNGQIKTSTKANRAGLLSGHKSASTSSSDRHRVSKAPACSAMNDRGASEPYARSRGSTMNGSRSQSKLESPPSTSEEGPRSSFTRTGRISRAKKGKPVHRCNICDKVYTRNEHLRRHQLNHSNSLRCDICGKDNFHRHDLLSRHKEEHNGANLDLTNGKPEFTNGYHSSPFDYAASPSPQQPASTPYTAGVTGLGIAAPDPSFASLPSGFSGEPAFDNSSPFFPCGASSLNPSPSLFRSPAPHGSYTSSADFFGIPSSSSQYFPTSNSFGTHDWSNMELNGSVSPASASSAANQRFQMPKRNQRIRSMVSPTESENSGYANPDATPPFGVEDGAHNAPFLGVVPLSEQDTYEEQTILRELSSMTNAPRDQDGQASLSQLENKYLAAFWQHFHPAASIIHRPTFEAVGTSPMVRALMIAIGSQFFDDETAQTISRCLRETCLKLISRRPTIDYSMSRLWDLQAVYLAEVFSLYCSRRPNGRFSQRFEDLLSGLLGDPDNSCSTKPLEVISTLNADVYNDPTSESHIQWVHLESKRRLLLACYALEVQQCLFFGSQRPVSDRNLPLPCSVALWESRDLNAWLMLAPNDVGSVMSIGDLLPGSNGNAMSQDTFLATTAIAHFTYNPTPWSSEIPAQDLLISIPRSPQCLFAYHASVLAANTPVHDLLAVSGESFVLGEKLATRDQFSQCLSELHAWNTESTRAEAALYHATELLKLSLHSGRCGLLNEDWSLVLASLVCWARIMWPAQKELAEQVPQILEVKDVKAQAVTALTSMTNSWSQWQDARPMDCNGARTCLMWVRERIEGHIGWLVQDGVGTLQKLVDGRVIELEQ